MLTHIHRIHKRQDTDTDIPTALGLNSATIASEAATTVDSFVFDTAAATGAANTGDAVAFSASATNTFISSSTQSTTQSSDNSLTSSSALSSAASPSEISMGTVIGACLGALAGAVALVLIGLWLYRRGTKPRARSPPDAHRDKERAWGKLEDDNEDRWEGKAETKRVVSVGPMEKLTMFKKSTPSVRTNYTHSADHDEPLPVAHFNHPFAQYHPNLAKELAQDDDGDLPKPPQRPFLARVEAVAPISWDGETIGRDSFLSLSSNPAMSPGMDLALPTPQLTSSEPHHWESAEVIHFDHTSPAVEEEPEPRRKSSNNPFFGARMSTHSTHSTRSRSQSMSRSRTPSLSLPYKTSLAETDPVTMPVPPPAAFTREEKGKYRAPTPPSPTSSIAPSTITGHNPFSDPVPAPYKAEHESKSSHDRALASLIAALGPAHSAADVQERLRVASMNPSVASESAYTETDYSDDATLHQSWPVPPSRP
ncbi:hypothetical protein DFH07DRAFT_851947 [Mycena maculata]|uniref:Uncharacterized protein n=1 Tax=Mycena maculata TaxID=230809 RepID=A0AAD7HSD8_9AGAR|nr:hypothetical protein DFH07DRAFT_851947 [Mycena maculata]